MATDLLNGQLGNILNLIGAVGGLGAAAMGLVDALKAFWGGPSNFGFSRIRRGCQAVCAVHRRCAERIRQGGYCGNTLRQIG